MAINITINEMLIDEITLMTSSMHCPGLQNNTDLTQINRKIALEMLFKEIDLLGKLSAKSQGLPRAITSAEKLQGSTDNLYLLKDSSGRGGTGELVGFLKVGRKNLFVYDQENMMYEVKPLCVLDFFVMPSHQRRGLGRLLFNYMLVDTNIAVQDLAIDGPSEKMENFLRKNYGIDRLLRQNNNFAVAPEFFANVKASRCDANKKDTGISKPSSSTPMEPRSTGRFATQRRRSCVGQIIHGEKVTYDKNNGEADVCEEDFEEEEIEHVPDVPVAVPEEEPKVELEQSSTRPSSLGVEPIAPLPLFVSPVPSNSTPEPPLLADTPAGVATPRDSTQLTKRGHFDVKFHHNKLW